MKLNPEYSTNEGRKLTIAHDTDGRPYIKVISAFGIATAYDMGGNLVSRWEASKEEIAEYNEAPEYTDEPAQTESKEEEKKMENSVKCTYEEKTRNGYTVTWETTDAEQVYSDLAHELISKKINACSYIRSIKRTPLYNGTQKITVTYDHGGRRIYIVSDH